MDVRCVRTQLYFRPERAIGWLVGHIHACARDVKLPAVVETADTAFFVPSDVKRRQSMRTELLRNPHATFAILEGHEVLAQDANARRRIVNLELRFVHERQ